MAPERQSLTERGDDAGEEQLIEAAKRDPQRFAELYERNFDRVYAWIVRRVRDRAEAQDLTAEVFHHALASLGQFEWRGTPFAAWLYRIAGNAVTDRARRLQKERGIAAEPAEVAEDPDEVEYRARVFGMIRELPPAQRRVLELRFAEQKSIREIARELGRSEGAIKQLQYRGLESLRARVGGKNG